MRNGYNKTATTWVSAQPGFTVKEKIQYSMLGIILLGGTVVIGRKIIKNAIAKNEQNKTLEEGSAPAYAKQIKMAFDNDGWWGTDKDALRAAIRAIPSKGEFRKVMASYKKLYNGNLLADMQDELKSTEYGEFLSIISVKPENYNTNTQREISIDSLQGWAKRLKAAFDISYAGIPGTDEPAIKAVFLEIPSKTVFNQVAAVYQSLYGASLIEDLKGELEFWEYDPMLQIINSKPNN